MTRGVSRERPEAGAGAAGTGVVCAASIFARRSFSTSIRSSSSVIDVCKCALRELRHDALIVEPRLGLASQSIERRAEIEKYGWALAVVRVVLNDVVEPYHGGIEAAPLDVERGDDVLVLGQPVEHVLQALVG